jgi:two-component system, chemotaxis family, CheB/CheR fusion protein
MLSGSELPADEARILASAIIDSTRDPILVLDRELRIRSANEAFLELSGLGRAEIEGRPLYEVDGGAWDLPELRRLLEPARPDRKAAQGIELEHEFERLGRRRLLVSSRRVVPLGLTLLIVDDVTARAEARAQRKLLLAELKHRVKNTLALVQSVAVHTGRRAPSFDQFMIVFGERLRALSRVHDLVVRTNWAGADLRDLVEQMLANHRVASSDQVEIEGEAAHLDARQGQSVGLVLHELASNAVRHGALSVPAGRLRIGWRAERRGGTRWLCLTWRESGRPLVGAPASTGFGRTVIERAAAYELGGTTDLRFEPDGLFYKLAFPLDQTRGESLPPAPR